MPCISTGIERLKSIKWQHLLGVKFPNLHDCISSYQFKYFKCCEIFVIASFIVQLELLFELCLSGRFTIVWFPPHFYLNYKSHKSFKSCKSFKASVWPKSFNCINSYPTTNPTHPPWLITKPSWFICSTSCVPSLGLTPIACFFSISLALRRPPIVQSCLSQHFGGRW